MKPSHIALVVLVCTPAFTRAEEQRALEPTTPYLRYWPEAAYRARPDWSRTRIDWRLTLDERTCTTTIALEVESDVHLYAMWLSPHSGSYDDATLEVTGASERCELRDATALTCRLARFDGLEQTGPLTVPRRQLAAAFSVRTARLEVGELTLASRVDVDVLKLEHPGAADPDHPTSAQVAAFGVVVVPVPAPAPRAATRASASVPARLAPRDRHPPDAAIAAYNARLARCTPRPPR